VKTSAAFVNVTLGVIKVYKVLFYFYRLLHDTLSVARFSGMTLRLLR
jgi:hypothetical protein